MMPTLEGFRAVASDWAVQAALAAPIDPETGKDPEWGKAAPAGILIWVILGVALFLLIKSMNKHIRRVPKSFEDEDAASHEGAGGGAVGEGLGEGAGSPDTAEVSAATDDASAVGGVISESGGPEDDR